MPRSRLGIFAKHWTPGQVKTRLGTGIGAERAARFHLASLKALLAKFGDVADERLICFWPPEKQAAFVEISPHNWQLQPQVEGDLGQRIRHFFDTAFQEECERVLLIGADSPNVPVAHVERALSLLDEHRLVLGPTEDGGYYLVGAYGKTPPIFQAMPWSTPQLWPATQRQLDAEGWQRSVDYEVLPTWYDVDVLDDLKRLHRELLVESIGDEVLIELLAQLEIALEEELPP